MRSSARCAVPALITIVCLAATLFAQAPAKQPAPKTPRGSVSGRVTIKDKPAPGVWVGLRRADGMNPWEQGLRAMTDADGAYRITNVAAGSYMIVPSTPAYVSSTSPYALKPVVVNEDENVEDVNFSLVRGGVITGKVTDADGRPVIQMQVDVFRADLLEGDGARQMYPANSSLTDDRGIYRIFGLRAGKYKVAAGRSDEYAGGFNPVQRNYKQVFYPDVSDSAKATTIEVSEGSETKDVDISVGRTMQTFSVSGHVINTETGLPVPNARFGLTRIINDRSEYVGNGLNANERGDFVIEGLLPGKYAILQYSNESNELRLETTGFDVSDQDVSDLTIKLAKGASIFGTIVFESDDKAARSKLPDLQLRGYVTIGPGYGNAVSSMIAADGSFRFVGLQNGVINISLTEKNMPFPPKGFAISRIERDGAVMPRLEVKDGESLTGVKIFISYGTATLRGVINVENGSLPANPRFMVRLTKPGENGSFIRPPQVDARGHFLMEGIAAGVYDLQAFIVGSSPRQPRSPKRSVTLSDGVVTDVTVTIDLSESATPNP